MARKRDLAVLEWLNQFDPSELFLTSVVIAELYYGVLLVEELERRQSLLLYMSKLTAAYQQRILVFTSLEAQRYGEVAVKRRHSGHQIETKDAMIAAVCLTYNATLATRNTRDFDGLDLKLINPFEA
jgi:hypothetical protein